MSNINPDEIAAALRTVVTRLIKKLRKQSAIAQQLSLTMRSTIAMLYQTEMLPSELAAAEKITNQSMSQILNHLQQLGFINRKTSATDKRKVLVTLSAKGEDFLLQMRSERNMWLSRAIAQTCNTHEQELLLNAIAPLTKLIDFE
ncbi:MarR family transcriptional regulator [Inquilinus sp. KBS0705]|nr:MarR family transcriptional regulator [Inquilinus sp. KBS0705]